MSETLNNNNQKQKNLSSLESRISIEIVAAGVNEGKVRFLDKSGRKIGEDGDSDKKLEIPKETVTIVANGDFNTGRIDGGKRPITAFVKGNMRADNTHTSQMFVGGNMESSGIMSGEAKVGGNFSNIGDIDGKVAASGNVKATGLYGKSNVSAGGDIILFSGISKGSTAVADGTISTKEGMISGSVKAAKVASGAEISPSAKLDTKHLILLEGIKKPANFKNEVEVVTKEEFDKRFAPKNSAVAEAVKGLRTNVGGASSVADAQPLPPKVAYNPQPPKPAELG